MIWYDYSILNQEVKISGNFNEYKQWLTNKIDKKTEKFKPLQINEYQPIENSL